LRKAFRAPSVAVNGSYLVAMNVGGIEKGTANCLTLLVEPGGIEPPTS
jgi:hypothetical protein